MTEKLSHSIASFLKSIIELGVCEDCSCSNAYQEPTEELLRSILHSYYGQETQKLPTSSTVLTFPSTGFSGDIYHPEGTTSGLWGAASRLISTPEQMSLPLVDYVDTAFTAISVGYGVTIDVLLRSLCLVAKVQKANLCAYYHFSAQREKDATSNNTNSPSASCFAQGPVPRQLNPFVNDEFFLPRHAPSSVPISNIMDSGVFPIDYHQPSPKIGCDSKMSSSNVTDECSVALEVSLLTATPCLIERQRPHELPVNPFLEPSPLAPLLPCSVCRSGNVFSLQYYNIHLFLAASLLLSLKIGVVAPTNRVVPADVARACGCELFKLLLAEWLICTVLDYNITISVREIESLERRLGIVEVME